VATVTGITQILLTTTEQMPFTIGLFAVSSHCRNSELAYCPVTQRRHSVGRGRFGSCGARRRLHVDPTRLALLSYAEPNHASCCGTFRPSRSLKDSRTFFANGRYKHFAIIARDSISGSFDVTQDACLPRLALRARRSRRTGALWACRALLPGTSLWTGGPWGSRRALRPGRPAGP
jgi:hypothetical protein